MIEVICKVCGLPLQLDTGDLTEHPVASAVLSLAKFTAHTKCKESADAAKRAAETTRILEMRTQAWGGICPPLYQHTDPARLTIAQKKPEKFKLAVEWSYGAKGLGLFGTSGGGKTRTAYLVLRRLFLDGKSIMALTHTEFSSEAVRVATSNFKGERDRWLRLMKTVDVLFIDDLGKSRFTSSDGSPKHAEEAMWDVCEYRFTHLLPFFFTCNWNDGDELASTMSEDKGRPFVRRLRDFCVIHHF